MLLYAPWYLLAKGAWYREPGNGTMCVVPDTCHPLGYLVWDHTRYHATLLGIWCGFFRVSGVGPATACIQTFHHSSHRRRRHPRLPSPRRHRSPPPPRMKQSSDCSTPGYQREGLPLNVSPPSVFESHPEGIPDDRGCECPWTPTFEGLVR